MLSFDPLFLLAAVVTCFLIFSAYLLAPRLKYRHIHGPKQSFFLGNLVEFAKNGSHLSYVLWQNKFEQMFKISLGRAPLVIVTEPKLFHKVFNDLSTFPDRPISLMQIKERPNNLIWANVDSWRQLRRATMPIFNPTKLHAFSPLINRHLDTFVQGLLALPDETQVNIVKKTCGMTLDVIGSAAFGTEINAQNGGGGEMAQRTEDILAPPNMLLTLMISYFPVMRHYIDFFKTSTRQNAINYFDTECMKLMKERQSDSNATKKHDFLTLMLESEVKETGEKLTEQQICHNSRSFLLAGHETTAKTLAATYWLLAHNPEVQTKLIAEIDRFNDGSIPQLSDLDKYEYLELVITESLRLFPIAPATGREVAKDVVLGDKQLYKGLDVIVPIYAVHHNPKFWGEDVEDFKPERFLSESEEMKYAKRYCYIPFGGGRHKCIGYKFAMEELKLALIRSYRVVEFRAPKDAPKTLRIKGGSATVQFVDGVPLIVKRRN